MQALPREGTAAGRSYRFRPPDPSWVSAKLMEEVRAELRASDPYITVWWSETRRCTTTPTTPGRFRVMEYLPRKGNWIEALTWENPDGSYRSPWPAAAIIRKLGSIRIRMDELARRVEFETEKRRNAIRAEFYDGMNQYAQDLAKRTVGSRATARSILHATSETADGIRRRAAAQMGMLREPSQAQLDNHARWLLEHFRKQEAPA